ncbi:hypothetical protein [Demequina globuliformis]|uniref:hypothetical protein n=1 Tax=Demequina globuliformis TaxID=676202 RepID=UPI000784B44A|nr:hypothetical protein [Demequina globuliformis]
MTTITLLIPNTQWLSSNQRLHWAPKAKRTAWIRELAWSEGRCFRPYAKPVRIVAHVGYAANGKADPANAYPTVKAAIDGLVAAGLLVEDSHEWVIGPDMRRDSVKAPKGHHTVRLEMQEVSD